MFIQYLFEMEINYIVETRCDRSWYCTSLHSWVFVNSKIVKISLPTILLVCFIQKKGNFTECDMVKNHCEVFFQLAQLLIIIAEESIVKVLHKITLFVSRRPPR